MTITPTTSLKGVYISKTKDYPFDLVSTGDFINPISEVFRLRDSQQTIIKDIPLYLVVANVSTEFIKLSISGKMTTIRLLLSWNSYDWFSQIEYTEPINALNNTIVIPFFLRIAVDDFLQLFNLRHQSSITSFKLHLFWI